MAGPALRVAGAMDVMWNDQASRTIAGIATEEAGDVQGAKC